MLLNCVTYLDVEDSLPVRSLFLSLPELHVVSESDETEPRVDLVYFPPCVFGAIRLLLQRVARSHRHGRLLDLTALRELVDCDPRSHRMLLRLDVLDAQVGSVLLVLANDGVDLDLLDESLPIGLSRCETVHHVVRIAMRRAVSECQQWIECGEGRNCFLALHVLWLIQDEHRPSDLHQEEWCLTLQSVGRLADHIGRFVEGIESHHHDLDASALRKLPYLR